MDDGLWLTLFGRSNAARSGSSASRLKLTSGSLCSDPEGVALGLRKGVLVIGPLPLPIRDDSGGRTALVSALGTELLSTITLLAQSSPKPWGMKSRLSLALERSKDVLVSMETSPELEMGPPLLRSRLSPGTLDEVRITGAATFPCCVWPCLSIFLVGDLEKGGIQETPWWGPEFELPKFITEVCESGWSL